MKKPIGIRDVAAHAGVSVGTVSNVINHRPTVTQANLERVHASMAELGFVRNDLARQLRMGGGTTIGLVVLNVANPFFADLAHALSRRKRRSTTTRSSSGRATRIPHTRRSLHRSIRRAASAGNADCSAGRDHPSARPLEVPWSPGRALFDSTIDPELFCSVTLDGTAGGYMATRHLIDTGRRRILFAGGPLPQVAERLAGASQAARESGSTALSLMETDDLTVAEGRAVGDHILGLARGDRPDAVFAANDLLAVGILQSLILATDLNVPEDIGHHRVRRHRLRGIDDRAAVDYPSTAGAHRS